MTRLASMSLASDTARVVLKRLISSVARRCSASVISELRFVSATSFSTGLRLPSPTICLCDERAPLKRAFTSPICVSMYASCWSRVSIFVSVYAPTSSTACCARWFAAAAVFPRLEPVTWIESSGAGNACRVVDVPGIGRAVTASRSFEGLRPATEAALWIASSLVTKAWTSPSVVGEVVTAAAESGASGWPR